MGQKCGGILSPPVQVNNLESCRNMAVGVAEAFVIQFCGLEKHGAAGGVAEALSVGVGLSHAAQVAHQGEHIGIDQGYGFFVRHGQFEPC